MTVGNITMTNDETRTPFERAIALKGGSNFRDLGGYRSGDGRHVRWRQVFRSGALSKLTDEDLVVLDALNVHTILDLRCAEEREFAPGRWTKPAMRSIDYPTEAVFAKALGTEALSLYDTFPDLLSPHLTWVFAAMRGERTPIVFHCSGGQDRTGVVSAVLLATLGVSRDQIVEDYALTTKFRRRENEIDLQRAAELAPRNAVAAFFSKIAAERGPAALDPRPLLDAAGRPKVLLAFEAIERKWGNLDTYLEAACGLDHNGAEELREKYLE